MVDFPCLTNVAFNTFSNSTNLTCLALRTQNNICTLSGWSAFDDTPIYDGDGYIYVPSALIEQYKTATNWTYFATKFRALEDYTVDGTVTGALDTSKI